MGYNVAFSRKIAITEAADPGYDWLFIEESQDSQAR